ncbi:LysM peptidoglycan-binding domain-containing protein [Myxococcota bacterium]|nr:LysM peptidoglycan-binding domain-containing protein [Myxococcota bacterium]
MLAPTFAVLLASAAAHAQSYSGTGQSVDQGMPSSPDYYTVQAGDTLWDISRTFLGNPEYWPRLWSINDYITNPHWIYPGNRIAFRLGTDTEPPIIELEPQSADPFQPDSLSFEYPETQCGPDVRFANTIASTRYAATGFLADDDDVELLGEVYKARSGHYWLAEGNLIYLKMEDPEAYDCGDVLTVFRRGEKKVRDPRDKGKRYGSSWVVVGEARVVHRVDDMIAAVVRTSYREIERGDKVGPLMPIHVELEVAPPQGELAGHIVGRPTSENMLVSTGETVFLNIGRADGTRVGDSFHVVVQRDDALDLKDEDESLPESVTGRVVVVRVDEYTSTAVITDASRPIDTGDRVVQKVDNR